VDCWCEEFFTEEFDLAYFTLLEEFQSVPSDEQILVA